MDTKNFGIWTATLSDPVYQGGGPMLAARVGTTDITIVIVQRDSWVGLELLPDGGADVHKGIHVAWSYASVLLAVQAMATIGGGELAGLAAAVGWIGTRRGWWGPTGGELIPYPPGEAPTDDHDKRQAIPTVADDLVTMRLRF